MTASSLRTLPYLGGKSPASMQGTGKWIASMIPPRPIYAESFAGMLGVLLSRSPSPVEKANDHNGLVIDWWEVLRDHSDELQRRLALTPYSSEILSEAAEVTAAPELCDDIIKRAWAVSIVCGQSIGRRLSDGTAVTWRRFGLKSNPGSPPAGSWRSFVESLPHLAERISRLEVDRRDAVEFTDALASSDNAAIYLDPPYRADHMPVKNRRYYKDDVDADALVEVLLSAKALVAVSGYPGDRWEPHLDKACWNRVEREVPSFVRAEANGHTRTEVLWMNYAPPTQLPLLDEASLS